MNVSVTHAVAFDVRAKAAELVEKAAISIDHAASEIVSEEAKRLFDLAQKIRALPLGDHDEPREETITGLHRAVGDQ